jgi:hypothetical protein
MRRARQRARRAAAVGAHDRHTGASRLPRPPRPGSAVGLRAQVRAARRLLGAAPGLRVYLGGGLALWLLGRTLVGYGPAAPLAGAAAGALRLVGLVLAAWLYFRRTGQLAAARADLRALRALLAERRPWREERSPARRLLLRLLGLALGVRE